MRRRRWRVIGGSTLQRVRTGPFRRPGLLSAALAVMTLLASCQYVPVQPHPLVGEGAPPGYIDGLIPTQLQGRENPFTLQDSEALTAGAALYLAFEPSCAACHGTEGRGDGPLSPRIEPGPADFGAPPMLNAFRNHQDYVFWWIAEGVPKTGMPPHRELMTDTQIWQVATYAWFLGEQAALHPTTRGQEPARRPVRPPFLPPARVAPEEP